VGKVNNVVIIGGNRKAKNSAPATHNGKAYPPRRRKNLECRPREYLTPQEMDRLISAAGKMGRHKHRDRTLLLVAYRHALRVGELVHLKWSQFDLNQGMVHINRLKNGVPSVHPLGGPEIRALRRLKREYPTTPYLFVTERGGPLTTSTVRKIVQRAGQVAGIEFPVHPHQIRHATGYKLANEQRSTRAIQLFMGHKNIQHTVRYTELTAARFNDFWED
jgi:type 1 fimbriae regulatory protein FimB/type 1 fimbriae regulatory protein FimE